MGKLFSMEESHSKHKSSAYHELRYYRQGGLLPVDFLFYTDSFWDNTYSLQRRSVVISLNRIDHGEFVVRSGERQWNCAAGDYLLVRENTFATWSVATPCIQREMLLFPPESTTKLIFSELFPLPVTLLRNDATADEVFRHITALVKSDNASGFELNALTWELLMRLSAQKVRGEYPEVLCKALDYVEHHFHHAPTVEEIADKTNVSRRTLSRLFAEYLNDSPAKYVNALRMERARNLLLLHLERNIKEIAKELNFSSPALFSESFRKFYGTPPETFRRLATNHS